MNTRDEINYVVRCMHEALPALEIRLGSNPFLTDGSKTGSTRRERQGAGRAEYH